MIYKKFLSCSKGNIALTFAILAAPLLSAVGVAIDYTLLNKVKAELQNAADSAALASAKELSLTNAKNKVIKQVAKSYVYTSLNKHTARSRRANNIKINTAIKQNKSSLTVDIEYHWKPFIIHYFDNKALPVNVSATANLAGTGKICMIGLDQTARQAIHLKKNASLLAPDCGIYSNSSDSNAIKVDDNAKIISGVTCSAGGVKGIKRGSFSPTPITDCPRMNDPLQNRIAPTVGQCDYKRFVVQSGSHTLNPGTYCKGLTVKGTAKVFLNPGIYIIKGNRLEISDQATFEGQNVGFYLSGHKAKMIFKKETTINLTAPEAGLMAGLLIFEDRNATTIEHHRISSDNARILLGTIYLPNGTLRIDSKSKIADKAAYTVIIARSIKLFEGPTLHLNSNYETTHVPVPQGLISDTVYLSK